MEDLNDLIKKIEGDDKTIKEIREKNEREIFDEFSYVKNNVSTNIT